jgi:hypothetical protein
MNIGCEGAPDDVGESREACGLLGTALIMASRRLCVHGRYNHMKRDLP